MEIDSDGQLIIKCNYRLTHHRYRDLNIEPQGYIMSTQNLLVTLE